MISTYQHKSRTWCTTGNGYLRPIAVDTETRAEGIKEYGVIYFDQVANEYAMSESMSHLTDTTNWMDKI